ncbi:XRE family transcriptional regulator, partial [Pantoea agglomerans]
MATYRELLEKESPEMQARVAARVEETSLVIALSQLRDELEISQTELARAIGISQPTLAKMENPEN